MNPHTHLKCDILPNFLCCLSALPIQLKSIVLKWKPFQFWIERLPVQHQSFDASAQLQLLTTGGRQKRFHSCHKKSHEVTIAHLILISLHLAYNRSVDAPIAKSKV